jgi:hypothetical protein
VLHRQFGGRTQVGQRPETPPLYPQFGLAAIAGLGECGDSDHEPDAHRLAADRPLFQAGGTTGRDLRMGAGQAHQDPARPLGASGMFVVESERPEAGEEPERHLGGRSRFAPVLAGRVAVGFELLEPEDGVAGLGGQIAVPRPGMAEVEVAVLVGQEEAGQLRSVAPREAGVVVDDRMLPVHRRDGQVPNRVARDLLDPGDQAQPLRTQFRPAGAPQRDQQQTDQHASGHDLPIVSRIPRPGQ